MFDLLRYVALTTLGAVRYLRLHGPGKKRSKKARRNLYRDYPLVTVLVPGKDEAENIESLIRSIEKQTYSNLEIILIDDGSTDQTSAIGRRLEANNRLDRFLWKGVRGGKSSAANYGLMYAEGKFVVHLDADLTLHEKAIENVLLPFYKEDNIGAVGGDVRVRNRRVSLATYLQAYEYLMTITYGRTGASQMNLLQIVSGAFGAYRTDTLRHVGGWDVGPGEDRDIVLKIRKQGLDIFHQPDAICYTNVPEGFPELTRQRVRWNRSTVKYLLRKHLDMLNPRSRYRMLDFVAVAIPVLYSIVFTARWPIYWYQMSIFHIEVMHFIIILTYLVYVTSRYIQVTLLKLIFGNITRNLYMSLLIFSPLMTLYTGVYLRIVRGYAYIMEGLFRASYWDSFNPWKVGREAKKGRT